MQLNSLFPSNLQKRQSHSTADARGLTATELAARALNKKERGLAKERRQEVENDTQSSTIEVDVSPTRSTATPSAPQESTESSEKTTLVLRTPERRRARRPPNPDPNTPTTSPTMTLPNSTAPPTLGEEQGKGKRKRRHSKRCNEAVAEGILGPRKTNDLGLPLHGTRDSILISLFRGSCDPASSGRGRSLSGVSDGPSQDKQIRNLDGRDKDSHTARIFQALLEHRYSRNHPQDPSLAGAESSIKAFPGERNGFLGQTAHDVLGANVVHKISSAAPLLNMTLKELEIPPHPVEAESPLPSDISSSQTAPSQIALQFAKKAASILETREVELLVDFLEKPKQIDREIVNRVVRSRLDAFYQAEVATTGEPRERLAAPSGPDDAELGIVLHCQSKKGDIGNFWDYESPSIQALTAKGLGSEFVYRFDWHWRAEESARRPGRSSCPASAWPRAKRSLHDALSSEILEILSLPWLIVGGACAKDNYRRTLSQNSRLLLLSLSPTVNIEFELDIRETSVKRITTYVPHPSSGFFHPSFSSNYAVILDANISFFLWLHGKEDTRSFFTATQSTIVKGVPGAAPLQELYSYRRREHTLGRKLAEDEYKSSFLSWAAKYLSARPSAILDRGESLANVIIKKIGDSISAKAADRQLKRVKARGLSNAGRKSAALRFGHTFRQFWDGQIVRVTKKGVFKIFPSENQASLELTGRKALYDLVKKSSNPVTIHFAENGIVLKQSGQVVFQKSSSTIEDTVQRARWFERIRL